MSHYTFCNGQGALTVYTVRTFHILTRLVLTGLGGRYCPYPRVTDEHIEAERSQITTKVTKLADGRTRTGT